ncbi:MAG TPA: hypothetical protein VFK10_00015 [Burkholderiaceae bacterium]|nr:hypothetical protein [Burkholderiaceae bacterium]
MEVVDARPSARTTIDMPTDDPTQAQAQTQHDDGLRGEASEARPEPARREHVRQDETPEPAWRAEARPDVTGDEARHDALGREVARRQETARDPLLPDARRDEIAMPHETAADDAAVATESRAERHAPMTSADDHPLAPLFRPEVAQDFRRRWDATQIGFVDDPRHAVKQADELVDEVTKNLMRGFADERRQLEAQLAQTASTEHLRMALQRYRSFFQRLLSL